MAYRTMLQAVVRLTKRCKANNGTVGKTDMFTLEINEGQFDGSAISFLNTF